MSNDKTPLDALKEYRGFLLEKRRQLVFKEIKGLPLVNKGGVFSPGKEPGATQHDKFLAIQTAIEAVDRALIEEQKISSSENRQQGMRSV